MHDRLAPAALVVAVFAAPLLWAGCGGGSSDPASCTPVAESCNDVDDDCDGETDEAGAAGCTTYYEDADGDGAGGASACLCVATAPFTLTTGGDCDDGNPAVFLGATETCNGVDDDCSGVIDQGIEGCCAPSDPPKDCGKAQGVCTVGTSTCGPTFAWGPCLDAGGNPVILQGDQIEVCDGFDNNCDGATDEDLNRACYSAPSETQDVGACIAGMETCESGAWVCSGAVLPTTELCNGMDDDCDGQTDEEIPAGAACDGGDGDLCSEGTLICVSGQLVCSDVTGTNAELCNGLDDDCDGQTDETFSAGGTVTLTDLDGTAGRYLFQTCGTGACAGGVVTCGPSGTALACTTHANASSESCNSVDDDCDGKTDEDYATLGDGCSAGTGTCSRSGSLICNLAGDGTQCSAVAGTPVAEICDGLDNNCDGTTDEGLTQSCYTGAGVTRGVGSCTDGARSCTGGAWGSCVGQVIPSVETCNGLDDDCNGEPDDNGAGAPLSQTCYYGPGGTAGVGICLSGTQSCTFGAWGGCVGQVVPGVEVCDDLDNDCDGFADEGSATGCVNFWIDADADGYGTGSPVCYCSATAGYTATVGGDCDDTRATIHVGATEICDGLDDDCDGSTDEGCDDDNDGWCDSSMTVVGTPPTCASGGGDCNDNNAAIRPGASEACDGIDNDCNPSTPDGLNAPLFGQACDGPDADLCADGIWTCAAGAMSCGDDATSIVELCNGLDDDCDGSTDEALVGDACPFQAGVCAGSRTSCSSGAWVACSAASYGPNYQASESACDGLDNDCDGTTDEMLPPLCPMQAGVCAGARLSCGGGAGWQACVAASYGPAYEPVEVTCADGQDNDCDGLIDLADSSCL